MAKRLLVGDRVEVVKDETGELLHCVGFVSLILDGDDVPCAVSFSDVDEGKADNLTCLPNGKWGAWFARGDLRLTHKELSSIRVIP